MRDVWLWWLQQMADLLRATLSRRRTTPATALIIAPDVATEAGTDTVALLTRRHRQEHFLGRFTLDEPGLIALRRRLSRRAPVILRLPPDLLLEREVTLPLAAEPEIGNTLRYSIDSLTPFAADELFWSWAVTLRDRVNRRLHLRLSLVGKAAVQPLIATLARLGVTPKLLEFPLSDTETRTIALTDASSRGRMLRQHAMPAIVACAAGALLAIAVLPIALDARALSSTEARIDALRPRVAQVEALRRRLAANADDIDVVTRERGKVGDALQVIALVTDVLPDDTYLTELSLHQRKLALTGQSAAAAKLIVALSAEPMLRNPEFVAPVTRAPMGGRDMFSIETEILAVARLLPVPAKLCYVAGVVKAWGENLARDFT